MLNYKNMYNAAFNGLNIKLRILFAIFACFFMFLVQSGSAKAANPASLSLLPSNIKVSADKNLVLKVHLNTGGQAVNVVQADISYPLNLFDPAKSNAGCLKPLPTTAQQTVKGTISDNGTTKGMVKLACAVDISGSAGAPTFAGEADIATISLHVRGNAPSTHDTQMLKFVTNNTQGGTNNYSGVARASDSANILGATQPADVTIQSKNQTFGPADLNNDMQINTQDLYIMVSNFDLPVSKAPNPKADLNNDHVINILDFSTLLSNQ